MRKFILSTIKHIKNELIAYLPEECKSVKTIRPKASVWERKNGDQFPFSLLFVQQFFTTPVKFLMDFFDWICLKWNWKKKKISSSCRACASVNSCDLATCHHKRINYLLKKIYSDWWWNWCRVTANEGMTEQTADTLCNHNQYLSILSIYFHVQSVIKMLWITAVMFGLRWSLSSFKNCIDGFTNAKQKGKRKKR